MMCDLLNIWPADGPNLHCPYCSAFFILSKIELSQTHGEDVGQPAFFPSADVKEVSST